MKFHYQLIVLGNKSGFINGIISLLYTRITELEIDKKFVKIIDASSFRDSVHFNEPCYCLYFGGNNEYCQDELFLCKLINNAVPILPIVSKLDLVSIELPDVLQKINAINLCKKEECENIVSKILEGFSLLRKERKIFISYRRAESSSVALQLYENFERHGFDVFLDTHSVQPTEMFQEELFQCMADCDVVLMLNTKDFFSSQWTKEEFDKANSMSIGIVQLIWPDVPIANNAKLFVPFQLRKSYFSGKKLKLKYIDKVVNYIESIRARDV